MKINEAELFYKWAAHSDATPFWYGKIYGDIPPSKEKFFKNWKQHYFNGSKPALGRCFLILRGKKPIGQINYNKINPTYRSTELDIIIADSDNWGKGYGSDAMRTLTNYLFKELDMHEVWVSAIKTNPRAIRMYQKAGFKTISSYPTYIKIDKKGTTKISDWVVLIKKSKF